jgi:energy-coupling factor transport system permease protein
LQTERSVPLFTDYTHSDNFFFTLDPRTKLTWMAAVSIVGLTAATPVVPALLTVGSLIAARAAGLNLRAFQLLMVAIGALVIPVLAIQVLFRPTGTRLLQVGPVDLTSGALDVTAQVVLGLLCLSSAFLEFVLWTHPMDLAQVLVRFGVKYRYAMLLGLALRFFPVLEQELNAIMDAQAARGLENQGFWTRGMGIVFILVPFCLRSIRRSGEIALAMELRGYGYSTTRTFLHRVAFRPTDLAVTGAIAGAFLAYWAARFL